MISFWLEYFVLTDGIINVQEGSISDISNMKGGKVAFVEEYGSG